MSTKSVVGLQNTPKIEQPDVIRGWLCGERWGAEFKHMFQTSARAAVGISRDVVSGGADTGDVHRSTDDRIAADVVLPPVDTAGVCGHEGFAICSFVGRIFEKSAPVVGARDGVSGVLSHGAEIL